MQIHFLRAQAGGHWRFWHFGDVFIPLEFGGSGSYSLFGPIAISTGFSSLLVSSFLYLCFFSQITFRIGPWDMDLGSLCVCVGWMLRALVAFSQPWSGFPFFVFFLLYCIVLWKQALMMCDRCVIFMSSCRFILACS